MTECTGPPSTFKLPGIRLGNGWCALHPWSRVAVPTLMNANAPEGSGNVSVFAAVAGKSIGYCTLDTCGGSTVGAAYDIDIVIEEL